MGADGPAGLFPEPIMRRMLLLLPLLAIAACSRYEGPREVYQKNRAGDRADLPGYTLDEQKQRARERNTFIEDNPRLYPNAYVDRPGGVGR
jgi:hypothetical protein